MRIKPILILLLAFAIFNLSCKKEGPENKGKDLILTEKEQQQVMADNAFSFKLLKEVSSQADLDKNLMLSGLSATMALSMTANGADGETLSAMRASLEQAGFTAAEINAYYNKLINELPALDPKATLNIANSIWYRQGFSVLPDFLKTNTESYKAKISPLDFNDPAALNTINNWVSQQTNNKIPSIIDKINSEMVMYLMNAVYFKGDWKYPFNKSNTAPAKFNVDATHQVDADFMHVQKASINSFVNSTVSVHELPYGNEKYSMVIVMPSKPEVALNDLINDLDANKWQTWMNGLNTHNAYFIMPKFKFSYTIILNDALSNLGMGIAFSPIADFTKISAAGGLNISEVKQKTFIEVDEKGTEAAAVTSVGVELTSMPAPLRVDRPFLFAIREMKTGLILFTGAVHNPNFN